MRKTSIITHIGSACYLKVDISSEHDIPDRFQIPYKIVQRLETKDPTLKSAGIAPGKKKNNQKLTPNRSLLLRVRISKEQAIHDIVRPKLQRKPSDFRRTKHSQLKLQLPLFL